MAKATHATALRDVERLFNAGTTLGLSDQQLLERYLDRSGAFREQAFEALLERHGPMVQRVCQSVLRNQHDVDDAFQATFLILVRRARSLWVRESIGPWLQQVAYRVAAGARTTAARRRRHEATAAERKDSSFRDSSWDDLGSALNQQIARLPERYRSPIVLCCLEGLTQQQAAGQLGWPMGTLQSRLARGRERLRRGLIRKGLAPSVVLSPRFFDIARARGPVSPELVTETINTVLKFTVARGVSIAGVRAALAALTEGTLKTMMWHNLNRFTWGLAAVALTAAGVGVWASHGARVPHDVSEEPRSRVEPSVPRPDIEHFATEAAPEVAGAAENSGSLKYSDGRADGKKSIGGSGELVRFSSPSESVKIGGVRLHGSRYGRPQPPDESFLIYFLSDDLKRILHTEMAPYSLLERGAKEWVDIRFDHPVVLPKTFWIALDFRATQSKGVYLSYDTSTGGVHSRVGLPGRRMSKVTFGGDWMIEAILAK